MNLDQAFEKYLPVVDAEMRRLFESPFGTLDPFYGMMAYHLGWLDESFSSIRASTGKRLRPILCLLSCGAAGGEPEDSIPAAIALELIHNFSLVHDDIQDNSSTRRHRKTVWKIWGQPHAINVGDGLFAMAFLSLAHLRGDLSAQRLSAIHQTFSESCLLLCEGQYMDMDFETRLTVDADEYVRMIGRKTAALLSCAAYVGALIAGEEEGVARKYRSFGEQLGLAFQVQDDILGIWGDPKVTGKPVADDILQCKKTLPVLYALQRERELDEDVLTALYTERAMSPGDIPVILEIFERLKVLDYTISINSGYCDRALEELEKTGGRNPYHAILVELVERLRDRPA